MSNPRYRLGSKLYLDPLRLGLLLTDYHHLGAQAARRCPILLDSLFHCPLLLYFRRTADDKEEARCVAEFAPTCAGWRVVMLTNVCGPRALRMTQGRTGVRGEVAKHIITDVDCQHLPISFSLICLTPSGLASLYPLSFAVFFYSSAIYFKKANTCT